MDEFILENCFLFFKLGIVKYLKGCIEKSVMYKFFGYVFEK